MTDITLDVKITSLAEIMDRLLNNNMEDPDWVFALIVVPTTRTMIGGTAAVLANVPNTDVQHILGNALRSLVRSDGSGRGRPLRLRAVSKRAKKRLGGIRGWKSVCQHALQGLHL